MEIHYHLMMKVMSLVQARESCHTKIKTISNVRRIKQTVSDKNILDVWHLQQMAILMENGNVMRMMKKLT